MMKLKGSYIFKALTALVLALLMVFGTVATSMAAVVDDLADSGVNADLAESSANSTLYYYNSNNWNPPYIWAWDNNDTNYTGGTWPGSAMSGSSKLRYYSLDTRATKVIFSNNGASQTSDITLPSGWSSVNNLILIDGGYCCINGSSTELFGSTWTASLNNAFTVSGSTISKTYSNVSLPAGDIEYKKVTNGVYEGGDNHKLTISTAGVYNVTFTLNTNSLAISATATAVATPSITLSTNKDSLYIGGGVTDTATITTTKANTSATPTYTVTRNGSAATSSHYTLSNGTFTPKVTGTFVITGSITDGSTYTDSVTITVSDRVVYLLGLTNEGTWTPTDSGNKANKMTYNSTAGVYEYTINLYQGATTYNGDNGFKIRDAGVLYGKNNTTLTTSSTSASGLTTSGGNIYLTTKNLSSVTSSTVPYKFTYNASTKAVTVYYPMKVEFNSKGGSSVATQVVAYGANATQPDDPTKTGYTFDGWKTTDGGSTAFSFNNITSDKTAYASWTGNAHTVSYPSTTTGYTLAGTKPTSADYGSTVSFTVTPISGYRIDSVKYTPAGGSATNCTAGSNNEYHFTMPDANVTVSVVAVRTYTVTVTAGTGGSVASSSKTVDSNTATTLPTATPAYGYKFVNWTVTTGTASLSSATSATAAKITTTQNVTVRANFAKDDAMNLYIAGRFHVQTTDTSGVWTNSFDSGNWSDNGDGNIKFTWDADKGKYYVNTHASLQNLTTQIDSNDPWFFVYDTTNSKGWHPSSNAIFNTTTKSADLTSNNTSANVRFNSTSTDTPVILWFDATTKTLSYEVPDFYNVTITAPTGGTTTASTSRTTAGTTVTLTAAPSTGYTFTSFTVTKAGGGTVALSGSGNTRTFTMPADNVTVTSVYTAITPHVNFTSYKTDNGSTYVAGGGELTATYSTSSGGSGGGSSVTYPDRYLWRNTPGNSENPAGYTAANRIKMTADTSGNYYASFNPGSSNFYFVINDSTTSATSGSLKLNSSTSCEKGTGVADWTTVGDWSSYWIGKGHLNSGTTLYVKFDPSANKVTMQNSAFSYTPAGSGSGGGSGSGTSGSVTSGGTVPYGANVTFTAEAAATVGGETYQFIGWYSTATPAANETALSTSATYTKNSVNSDVTVYARYKRAYYLTFYNSYVQENVGDDFVFTAAPPRTVTVGMGSAVRATYTYKAGNEEQRGEEHTKNSTGDYYEGNRLLVLVGETVTLKFSTLASSDAISGIFFNNALRYSTETESDNLYKYRVKYTGSDPDCWGDEGDDEWDYDYEVTTTIFADEDYYEGEAKSKIQTNAGSYVGQNGMNQGTHTISWVATQNYLNIDIELGRKYQLHINDDKAEGINISNMNDEGYYYGGEVIESTSADHTNGLKITLDNTTDTTGTYSFSSATPVWKDKDGNTVSAPSGITVKAYTSGNTETTTASSIDHFLIYGTMPHSDVYLTIPVVKKYNLKLSNIVVSDNGANKRTMITECSTNSTSASDCIGTISGKVNGTTQATLTDDGTYYTYPGNNNAGHVEAYTTNSGNKYLNGGVNRNGYNVTAGDTVTYEFTFKSGKDAEYTFVGWFEGTYANSSSKPTTDFSYDVDYNKKLSGKTSFTFTPSKNTVVIAVATRDIYIGGNFTKDGAYATTDASATWSANRPMMEFDPTYVNPEDPTKKGRYYYTFDTVTNNTEYKFRCYDTASGGQFDNLSVWNTWLTHDNGASTGYNAFNTDIAMYRDKYDAGGSSGWTTHGGFVYTTNTTTKITTAREQGGSDREASTISQNHQSNGYAAPVTVYFYAYDGGISVNSTYQWSRAYVSEGRGIDVKSVSGSSTTYNNPTASVVDKTVNNQEVTVIANTTSYGHDGKTEKIYECLVKEKDGSIVVSAQPHDVNVELQAFVVYNIETKKSEAVKTFTTSGSGDSITYTANIQIPNNSKIYICPVYKFTDNYIDTKHLETHNVFVRADEIDKDDWGGLVAMYSWGTTEGYDSGGWPGQLMIPSDDGHSFYAPLTFEKGALAGVTFNNYTTVYDGDFINFLGKYQDAGVSNVAYSGYTKTDAANNYIYQVYDYREPISIIENLNESNPRIYEDEDMTLTFALKPGNKTSETIGNGAYNSSFSFEYLTDSSGKYRVDLNGNKISTNPTASYYVVCNYTEAYGGSKTYDFKDGSRDGTSTHNKYSIDWNVYDQNHVLVANGTKLSAAFTDVHKAEMLTHIAQQLIDDGQPVSGKAVMIAYENPKISSSDETEAVRYSGQWYADGLNTIIKGNVRVGIFADGAWLPSDSNAPGYATATVSFTPNTSSGEKLVTETGCSGNSLAEITKIHASNGDLQFSVNTTDNFLGWYIKTKDGSFEPIGSNYKSQAITPSFNEDITYYAFYSASASYRFAYTSRLGGTRYFTAKGTDLSNEEMAANGILNPATRASDITTQLAKATTDITKFNTTMNFEIKNADISKAYTITYTASEVPATYTLTPYAYNSSGALAPQTTVSGNWSKQCDLPKSYVNNKPSGQSDYVFVGWVDYATDLSGVSTSNPPEILSTQANFGYCLSRNMQIKPFFAPSDQVSAYRGTGWSAVIERNEITQELDSANAGTIFNDSLVNFRNKEATGTQFVPGTTDKCGILIFSQDNSADSTAIGYFNTALDESKMHTYVEHMVNNNLDSAKLPAKYGSPVALKIQCTADTLSNLNRADLYQIADYAKYNGGKYKIVAYTKVGSQFVYSTVTEGTFTPSGN